MNETKNRNEDEEVTYVEAIYNVLFNTELEIV